MTSQSKAILCQLTWGFPNLGNLSAQVDMEAGRVSVSPGETLPLAQETLFAVRLPGDSTALHFGVARAEDGTLKLTKKALKYFKQEASLLEASN